MYFVKTPRWLKEVYRNYVWDIPVREKKLFLSFDDGPHPVATPFVLNELAKYNAKGTFFCIGRNVEAHPQIFTKVCKENHSVGNHTHNHLNGWKTSAKEYLENVAEAGNHIHSRLFRPPYGRIKKQQGRSLLQQGFKVLMWDVLSGDFDKAIRPEKCLQNVVKSAKPGSIVVFHDSEKALANLKFTLPRVLEHFSQQGYQFDAITENVVKGPE